jgi:pyridoxal phosphate enzyme (YggS family)
MSIGVNLAGARDRIVRACARCGRDPSAVTLVAVSKTHPAGAVIEAAAAGQVHFGENRVQEAREKIPACPGGLVWHLVGHLQSNKARDAARLFAWVHSIDSATLAVELDRRLEGSGRSMEVLLEVKLADEETKRGAAPETVRELAGEVARLKNLRLRGLMTIPPLEAQGEEARPYFRELARLRGEIAAGLGLPAFDQLSMGMSGDVEAAVEEGATLVRVGTAIFGAREQRL